jgi:hypothetical protein
MRRSGISHESRIVKTYDQMKRRITLGGVVGNRVVMPGSPAITLTELLKEAEVGLEREGSAPPSRHASEGPVGTPSPPSRAPTPVGRDLLPREWTRNDWKLLDACFVDERAEEGKRLGLGDNVLAGADDVCDEEIVNKFIQRMGGPDIVNAMGPKWTR